MSTKQLVFVDTEEDRKSGTFERFHAEQVRMHTDNSIRISNTSTNLMVLDVYGHVLADKIRARSDSRLKTDIRNIDSGLKIVKQLCGKIYKMKDETGDSYGLIAQEVQEVIPSIVYKEQGHEGYLNVSYLELIPVMIESIKELDTKLNQVLNTLLA